MGNAKPRHRRTTASRDVLRATLPLVSARQNKTKSLLLRNDVYLQSSIEAKDQILTALTT